MIGVVVAIVYIKMRNTPVDPDGPHPAPHVYNVELLLMNEEYQKSIDYIYYINATNETTIIDIFNKLPRMSLERISSIRAIDEDANLTYDASMNDELVGS